MTQPSDIWCSSRDHSRIHFIPKGSIYGLCGAAAMRWRDSEGYGFKCRVCLKRHKKLNPKTDS